MKSKLVVKNFGPIESATLNLRNVNVFIGPQASGKSTLAKLYTICKSPILFHNLKNDKFPDYLFFEDEKIKSDFFEVSFQKFKDSLGFYSILDFYSTKSEIEFDCPTHYIHVKNNNITFEDKFEINKIILAFESDNKTETLSLFNGLRKKSENFNFRFIFDVFYARNYELIRKKPSNWVDDFHLFRKNIDDNKELILSDNEIKKLLATLKNLKSEIFNNNAFYIPSERTIVGLLKQAALNINSLNIPIPKHLLDYAAKYNSATFEIKEFDLSFIKEGTFYKNIKGDDYIYYNKNKRIRLSESASGIQSIIPILLPIENKKNNNNLNNSQYSFVIEEPETNLFPKAQYELLKFLEKSRNDDFGKIDKGIIHTYTTHSPFILSSLNNMLYAFKKGNLAKEEVKSKIAKILEENNWIDPEHFSAYQIIDGKAKSIMDRKTGLIKENVIDYVSEEIIEDFRKIALATI
jgi:hypothetical protein